MTVSITRFVILSLCLVAGSEPWKNNISKLNMNPELTKVVIDTDAGVDDAFTILLLLAAEKQLGSKFEIVAITCTYGNADVDNVVQNVLKTLTVAKRNDIPVYRGAYKPFLYNRRGDNFFGNDGFGDVQFEQEITAKYDSSKHAASALIEIAKKYAGEISVLTLGPLTNIAMAITLDSAFVNNVKRFYSMGGSVHGEGNIGPNVEFNFVQDPESNIILFNSVTEEASIVLTPWETVVHAGTTKDWLVNVFETYNSSSARFLKKIHQYTLSKCNCWSTADIMCAAVMLWPDLANKTLTRNVSPVVDGTARGSLMVDYNYQTNKLNNTEIVDKLNTRAFFSLLIKYITLF